MTAEGRIEKFANTDNYRVELPVNENQTEVCYIDVKYYKNDVSGFVIHRTDARPALVKLTRKEILAVVELAKKLGLVGER